MPFPYGDPWARTFYPSFTEPNPRMRDYFQGYRPSEPKQDDSDKIIDVFEPTEGSLLILNKQLDTLDLMGLRDKMRKKRGYLFNTISVEQGVLISWAPRYQRTA